MKGILLRFLVALQLVAASCLGPLPAFAGSYAGDTYEFSCPASGSSAEIFGGFTRRGSWAILNESGTNVRIGMIRAELGTPSLTTANSVLLLTGKSLADSGESVYIGRVVCMSTTASPVSVGVIVTNR